MFIRSVSVSLGVQQDDLEGIEATYVAIGDDTLSGDPQRGRATTVWPAPGCTGATEGIGTSAVGDCNTFVAPAGDRCGSR